MRLNSDEPSEFRVSRHGRNHKHEMALSPRKGSKCPLWVISGHRVMSAPCPLCPRKRTFISAGGMSAKCHKRTFAKARRRDL